MCYFSVNRVQSYTLFSIWQKKIPLLLLFFDESRAISRILIIFVSSKRNNTTMSERKQITFDTFVRGVMAICRRAEWSPAGTRTATLLGGITAQLWGGRVKAKAMQKP